MSRTRRARGEILGYSARSFFLWGYKVPKPSTISDISNWIGNPPNFPLNAYLPQGEDKERRVPVPDHDDMDEVEVGAQAERVPSEETARVEPSTAPHAACASPPRHGESDFRAGPTCTCEASKKSGATRADGKDDPSTSHPRYLSGLAPETDPQLGSRTEADPSKLSGWAAIEDRAFQHDAGMMKNYSEDIDTLLVFAGLFSGVLTAFVVPAYQLLQPDNSDLSLKALYHISAQLSSFKTSEPFVNSTVPPLSVPPSFTVPSLAVARSLNIIWFLSLVFGLASALFGILVKQWIREYLEWNSALALPRQNMMVRQLRYEAWNTWNVPATIVIIPALLEISVVLFLTGVIVLLWTLDIAVAIVITFTILILFSITATTIILPAFTRYCPYKSPTGWAFTKFWDFVARLWVSRFRSQSQLPASFQSWREREMSRGLFCNVQLSKSSAPVADPPELNKISLRIPPERQVEHFYNNNAYRGYPDLIAIYFAEVVPMVRAIAWSYRAFQDDRIEAHISECLRPQRFPDHPYTAGYFGPVTAYRHLLDVFVPNFQEIGAIPDRSPCCLPDDWFTTLARQSYHLTDSTLRGKGVCLMVSDLFTMKSVYENIMRFLNLGSYKVFSHLTLHYLDAEWSNTEFCPLRPDSSAISDHLGILFFSRRVVMSLRSPLVVSRYRDILLRIYRSLGEHNRTYTAVSCDGLRTVILLLLCESGRVCPTENGIIVATGNMEFKDFAELAMHLYAGHSCDSWESSERKHAFVMLVDCALYRLKGTYADVKDFSPEFFRFMASAVRELSASMVRDCGSPFIRLPWIYTMLEAMPLILYNRSTAWKGQLGDFIDAFGEGLKDGTITGDDDHRRRYLLLRSCIDGKLISDHNIKNMLNFPLNHPAYDWFRLDGLFISAGVTPVPYDFPRERTISSPVGSDSASVVAVPKTTLTRERYIEALYLIFQGMENPHTKVAIALDNTSAGFIDIVTSVANNLNITQ